MADSRSPVGSSGSRWRYQVEARTAAPPSSVWPLVAEAERWKEWSFLRTARLDRPGSPVPDGVGALRRFAVGRFGSSEEVVEWEPPRHLAYVARKGIPVRSYRADVWLREDRGGTAITWTGSLEPLIPGTGGLLLAGLGGVVRLFARELVRFADRTVSPAAG